MSDEMNDVVENVKQGSTWLRIVLMIGFYVVLYVVGVVVVFVTLAQALFTIFTGSDNSNLRQLGASLSEYVSQILLFVTYNSETRPFPFTPFPAAGDEAKSSDHEKPNIDVQASAAQKTSTRKKSASAAKKKPATKKKPSEPTAKKPSKTKSGSSSTPPGSKEDQ